MLGFIHKFRWPRYFEDVILSCNNNITGQYYRALKVSFCPFRFRTLTPTFSLEEMKWIQFPDSIHLPPLLSLYPRGRSQRSSWWEKDLIFVRKDGCVDSSSCWPAAVWRVGAVKVVRSLELRLRRLPGLVRPVLSPLNTTGGHIIIQCCICLPKSHFNNESPLWTQFDICFC